MERVEIQDLGGQGGKVVITKRDNGTVYVTFKSEPEYGYPSFEEEEIECILRRMTDLGRESRRYCRFTKEEIERFLARVENDHEDT